MMNSHGALAAMLLLVNYQMLQYCDIVETDEAKGGMPRKKCEDLLFAYRDKYKNSPIWILEEARLLTQKKEVEKAIELLEFEKKPQMRYDIPPFFFPVGSYANWDIGIGKSRRYVCLRRHCKHIALKRGVEYTLTRYLRNLMCLHRYEKAAQTFLHLVDLNSWSDAMYYYIAGSCYVELYREAVVEGNQKKAEEWSKKAEDLFLKVAGHLGKKKFMARALPLETFTDRKVKKWQRFAKERKCGLVEAVGVSPLEEMIYMWSTYIFCSRYYIF